MAKGHDNAKERKEAVSKFEQMLRNNQSFFFESFEYDYIISHYMEKSQWKQASKACELAISQYPYSIHFLLDKVAILTHKKQFLEAHELLDKAEHLQPNDVDIIIARSHIFMQNGDFEKNIQYLQYAIDLSSEPELIYYQLGLAYQSMERYEQAIIYHQKALEQDIENEEVFFELAFCLDMSGKLEESIAYYQRFIDRDPYSHFAWYNLGLVYSKLEHFEQALTAYEYATIIKDDFSSAWFNLGNTKYSLQIYEEAIECYQKVLELEDPTAEPYCYLGNCYEKLMQLDLALEQYKLSLSIEATYPDALYGMAICLYKRDKWYEAYGYVRRAVDVDHSNGDYWLTLADIEMKMGNTIHALEAYERAAQLCADNPDVWINWSLTYYENGEHDKAFNIASQGLTDNIECAELHYHACVYLINQGKYREALEFLQNALNLDFGMHTILFDFFKSKEVQIGLNKIIEQYKNR